MSLTHEAGLDRAGGPPPAVPRRRRAPRRRPPVVALGIVALVVVCVVFGPLLAPHDPNAGSLTDALLPPFWADNGTWSHPLGTDQLGRDLLSRLIVGARLTLLVALAGVVVSGVLGSLVGLLAGYFGGLVDEIVMRLADAALAIPLLVLGLALAAVHGPSTANVILVVSALTWAFFARLVRGEVLALRTSDYVTAVVLLGLPRRRVLLRHILPNVANPIIVLGTLQIGNVVIMASGLSFLGLGAAHTTPEWGYLLADSQDYLALAPWLAVAPAVALAAFVLSTNTLGDWLGERLDPRRRAR
jgi:peptide/nickel transport system permease protein